MTTTTPPQSTSFLEERRARQHRRLVIFIVASFALHLFAVGAWAFFPRAEKPAINLDRAVKARLVKLGTPRDEKLLPRIPTTPPPKPADQKAPPTPEKPTPEKPTETLTQKASTADVLQKFEKDNETRDVKDVINRRLGEQTDDGQKDGDVDGTELSGELQAQYADRLIAHIRRHTEVSSTLSDDERVRLKAALYLRVDEEGKIVEARIAKSSGSGVYDADVVAAAQRASPVPAPPIPLRALFADGVVVNFCPVSCG